MPQTTFTNQVFCLPSDVSGYYVSIGLLKHSESSDSADEAEVQQCIDIAKEIYLRQPLIAECQQRFPDKIEEWQNLKRAQIDQKYSGRERSVDLADRGGKYPLNGMVEFDGEFFDITDVQNFTRPATFYFAGTPVSGTSGTYVNTSVPGDILFDTTTDLSYINRGTTSSPTWQRFVADDGIDFILNPQELKWVNIFACGKLMAERGFLADKPNYQNMGIKAYFRDASDMQMENYTRTLKMALPRVHFNISGSGTATAFELEATDGEIILF